LRFGIDGPYAIHAALADTTCVSETRYVLALAADAARVRSAEGALVIDELPGVVLVEAGLDVAKALAREGEYVGVYTSLAAAHRAFALFQPAS
jgi:hypothetical protein